MKNLNSGLASAIDVAESPAHSYAPDSRLALAKWLYQARDLRPCIHIAGLFGEPAWDILLDLYICQGTSRPTSVTSSCLASRAPATTALRYIQYLCDHDVIVRTPDNRDRRRSWLRLSSSAEIAMDRYLDQIMRTLRTEDRIASKDITELGDCIRQMKALATKAETLLGKLR